MKFIKNYKNTLILLLSIIVGGVLGLTLKDKILFLKPLGDIFINLMFVIVVPLIFLTISSAIIKMKDTKRLGNILIKIVIVFAIFSIISALIGIISTKSFKLVSDSSNLSELLDDNSSTIEDLSILERTTSILTVNDTYKLLSKDNIIALLVFTIIFAFAVRMSKEKGLIVSKVIFSLNDIIQNIVKIIMYYAPIGLGCYFAALVAELGSSIAIGFIKTFVVYTLTCLFVYFVIYSLYAFIAGGRKGLKSYWKNIIPPTITSISTCSSSACIPINVNASKKIGVPDDIADTVIPLGTSFHKDGSVIGSVFKIMFLVYMFGMNPSIYKLIGVSLLATLLVTAVPVGGGTISEMFIISLMGFPLSALPILTIIATIIDAPATLLNVVGDTASSMVVTKFVDGNRLKL